MKIYIIIYGTLTVIMTVIMVFLFDIFNAYDIANSQIYTVHKKQQNPNIVDACKRGL
jgi:hypothetical protein